MTQLMVIVSIFVTSSDTKDATSKHLGLVVSAMPRIAWIWDRTIDTFDEFKFLIGLTEQQQSAIGG
jgi:hypothetical protein